MSLIRNNQNGFTLIELLIAMTAIVLLLAALSGVLSTSLRAWQIDSRKIEAQQTARSAIDAITRDVRYAKKIEVDSNGQGIMVTQSNSAGTLNSIHLYCTAAGVLYRRNVTTEIIPQPVTGGDSVKVAIVFTQDNKRTLTVDLDAVDTFTDNLPRQTMTFSTKVISMNIP